MPGSGHLEPAVDEQVLADVEGDKKMFFPLA